MITTLANLIEAKTLEIGDGYRAKNEELGGDGLIFLRSGHVSDTGIDFSGAERFRCMDEHKFRRKVAAPGDVIVTTKGWSTGRVSFVDAAMPRFVYSPHLSYWRSLDPNRICPAYLRQWSRSPECQRQLNSIKMGIDIHPYLSLETQRGLAITLPALGRQRAIASILGALDDKIELNRRMNETLEEMARTIFRSWFVDFDPVKAKAEGRQPEGMDAETAALFPSRFVESESGMIPEGWTRGTIAALLGQVGGEVRTGPFGTALKAEEYSTAGVPSIAVRDIRVGYVAISASTPRVPLDVADRLSAFRVKTGDIIFGRKGAVERFALIGPPEDGWIMGSDCIRLRVPQEHAEYLVRQFQLDSHRSWMHQHATGTTMPSLNQGIIERIPLVLPPREVVLSFAKLATRLTDNSRHLRGQSGTLSALRDSLLPKLISGELRIPDAEKLAEAAL